LKDPDCFKVFCGKLGIRAYRTFRRAFNESLRAIPCLYIATKEQEFKGKNIINEMLFAHENGIIDYTRRSKFNSKTCFRHESNV